MIDGGQRAHKSFGKVFGRNKHRAPTMQTRETLRLGSGFQVFTKAAFAIFPAALLVVFHRSIRYWFFVLFKRVFRVVANVLARAPKARKPCFMLGAEKSLFNPLHYPATLLTARWVFAN